MSRAAGDTAAGEFLSCDEVRREAGVKGKGPPLESLHDNQGARKSEGAWGSKTAQE